MRLHKSASSSADWWLMEGGVVFEVQVGFVVVVVVVVVVIRVLFGWVVL